MPHNDILAKLKDAVRSVSDNIQNYVSNVQKRAKLSPAALRDVFYRFNQSLEPSSSTAA